MEFLLWEQSAIHAPHQYEFDVSGPCMHCHPMRITCAHTHAFCDEPTKATTVTKCITKPIIAYDAMGLITGLKGRPRAIWGALVGNRSVGKVLYQ